MRMFWCYAFLTALFKIVCVNYVAVSFLKKQVAKYLFKEKTKARKTSEVTNFKLQENI